MATTAYNSSIYFVRTLKTTKTHNLDVFLRQMQCTVYLDLHALDWRSWPYSRRSREKFVTALVGPRYTGLGCGPWMNGWMVRV